MKKLILISALLFVLNGCSEKEAYEQSLGLVKAIENSGKTDGAYWLEQKCYGYMGKGSSDLWLY